MLSPSWQGTEELIHWLSRTKTIFHVKCIQFSPRCRNSVSNGYFGVFLPDNNIPVSKFGTDHVASGINHYCYTLWEHLTRHPIVWIYRYRQRLSLVADSGNKCTKTIIAAPKKNKTKTKTNIQKKTTTTKNKQTKKNRKKQQNPPPPKKNNKTARKAMMVAFGIVNSETGIKGKFPSFSILWIQRVPCI